MLEVGAATTLLFCDLQPTHMWWRGVFHTEAPLPSPQEVTAMCTSQHSEPLLRAKSIPVLKLGEPAGPGPGAPDVESGSGSEVNKPGAADADGTCESTESGATAAARLRSASAPAMQPMVAGSDGSLDRAERAQDA